MSDAREAILARVRAALADVRDTPPVEVPRSYRTAGESDERERVSLLARRLAEHGAAVVQADDAAPAVEAALARHGVRRVVVDGALDAALRPAGAAVVIDAGLSARELDGCDAVVTTCAAACAETGTFALDGGPGQGRRAITLVPDVHVCVVRHDQVVQTVPELLERLEPAARAGRPIVLVSGPSATSDIELSRVEGVHGPRRLVVVLTPGPGAPAGVPGP
jgi:L-lactate dehydrogenase complex protein LldG